MKGTIFLTLFGFLLLIIPGILYYFWRRTDGRTTVCPKCEYEYAKKLDHEVTVNPVNEHVER